MFRQLRYLHLITLGVLLTVVAGATSNLNLASRLFRCPAHFADHDGVSANPLTFGEDVPSADRGHVVIVDAYSSGNLLAAEFKARGFEIVHIRSGMHISNRLQGTFVPKDFKKDFDSQGKVKEALAFLNTYPTALVVAGAESGVTFAERLATAMGTPTNNPRFIGARRNKYQMVRALRGPEFEAQGLFVPKQELLFSEDAAVKWVRENLGEWSRIPGVVVKPKLGSGGSQVELVGSDEELRKAVRNVLTSKDHYGVPNAGVIVAEKIVGDEYALNGAVLMHEGKLHVALTDAWFYNKTKSNGDAPKYGHEDLVPFAELPPKTMSALSASLLGLGYLRGGFHEEVIVQEGTGKIYFVEVGSRLYGAGNPAIAASCTPYGQVKALVDSYLAPDTFLHQAATPYELTAHASVFNVNAPTSDEPLYVSHQHLPMLQSILGPSLFKMIPFFPDGATIEPTRDLGSTLLQIEIRHRDRRIVDGYIQYLKGWQADGYFWKLHP